MTLDDRVVQLEDAVLIVAVVRGGIGNGLLHGIDPPAIEGIRVALDVGGAGPQLVVGHGGRQADVAVDIAAGLAQYDGGAIGDRVRCQQMLAGSTAAAPMEGQLASRTGRCDGCAVVVLQRDAVQLVRQSGR